MQALRRVLRATPNWLPSLWMAVAMVLPDQALGQFRPDAGAHQAVALFLQSCVSFAADAPGLRGWAASIGLRALPEQGQAAFMKGARGTVFDASGVAGKLVVISHDDGGCAVLAQSAEPTALARAAEAGFAAAAIGAVLDSDRDDPENPGLRHRTYHASQGERSWTFVISMEPAGTGRAGVPGQAMLSATRR